jgi:Arc/MetJ-type ribon-helix-helix transcriptional regulator
MLVNIYIMKMPKIKNKYDTIKIPEGLTLKIDQIISESEGDFTSRTDVIKYAVRLLYKELIN